MPTPTTRLGLIKQAQAENVNIDLISDSFDKLDLNPGVFVCTSTTRPTSTWDGRVIFETDTGKLRVRNGSEWLGFEPDSGTLKGFRLLGKTASQTVNTETAEINRFAGRTGDPGDAASFIKVASNTSTSAPSTTVTCGLAGKYRVNLRVVFQQTNANLATNTVSLTRNSATVAADGARRNWVATELSSLQIDTTLVLSAGDILKPIFNAGSLTAVYAPADYWTTFDIIYEGPA